MQMHELQKCAFQACFATSDKSRRMLEGTEVAFTHNGFRYLRKT